MRYRIPSDLPMAIVAATALATAAFKPIKT
jgi:hypothetical protein